MKVLILTLLIPLAMNAQDLKKHKWENRLIVISSPTFEDRAAAVQLSYLNNHQEEIRDRKLIIYHVTNTGYTTNFDGEIIPSTQNEVEISEFNCALIGLDGTAKYQTTSPQPAAQFFNLIDKMPMRRAEMDH